MKTTLATIITAALLSTPALANTFESQHRVGLGYASTDLYFSDTDSSLDWGNGIKFEYGYEFNRIVGINTSYSQNNETFFSGFKMEGSSFKLDTDIGYKFLLDGFSIKPYGAIGVIRYSEKYTISNGVDSASESWNDTNLFIGTGVRAEIGQNFYTDIRFDFTYFNDGIDDVDYDQFSWTVGYKF
ncbi:porin family protein [Vibrio lamellibrachiae]|uniref:porin family protein n=1 Tax=Vibrio lamellibrachiae TaxID=2910253 RepID=UPI003D10595B